MLSVSSFLLFITFFTVGECWTCFNHPRISRSRWTTLKSVSVSSSSSSSDNNKVLSSLSSRRIFFTTTIKTTMGTSAILGLFTTLVMQKPVPVYALSSTGSSNLPTLGIKAPDFDLPNSQGTGSTTLESLTNNGKWTVLYFYPGAFTSGCTLEARGFQQDMDQYRALNTQIVGVSVDSVEKNAQFCSTEKLDFFMLTDEKGEVSKLYGSALTVPGFGTFSNRQTYIIDPEGNLQWVFTDVESRVSRHSAEVLAKLEELSKQQEKEVAVVVEPSSAA